MKKTDIVKEIIRERKALIRTSANAFASTNIALCKYWGKRNQELNLPITSSLSISMGELGTSTEIFVNETKDEIFLNEKRMAEDSIFFKRIVEFLDLFRLKPGQYFSVHTFNTIPTSAGLASSASGFAALVLALNGLFSWNLGLKDLSILARLGSGSACRSLHQGFVEWAKGSNTNGLDSYATPLQDQWKDLRIGVVEISRNPKEISSRTAMRETVNSSSLYSSWPKKVEQDLFRLKEAIRERDFPVFGSIVESNSLAMHATMISAWPPILYWQPKTVKTMKKIWDLRKNGLELFFTMDAGPNLKLLFLTKEENYLISEFPKVKIIAPFA